MKIKITASNSKCSYSETIDLFVEYRDMFDDWGMSEEAIVNFVRPLVVENNDFAKINGNHLLYGVRESWMQSKRPEIPAFVRGRHALTWQCEHLQ